MMDVPHGKGSTCTFPVGAVDGSRSELEWVLGGYPMLTYPAIFRLLPSHAGQALGGGYLPNVANYNPKRHILSSKNLGNGTLDICCEKATE